MSTKQVIVQGVRAVGMHHHGASSLVVNGLYTLRYEPDCLYDLGNAIAVHDHHGIKRAYLARDDAYFISSLFYADLPVGKVLMKPKTDAHVVQQHLGPQHECDFKFTMANNNVNINFVEQILNEANITYSIK